MSIADFIHQFTGFSIFHSTSIDTEKKKVKRFARGLRVVIHKDMTSIAPITFDGAVKRAYNWL